MSIQFGDILGHNNPNYPIADVTDVKGGLRIIDNFSNIDLYNAFDGIPEKLKQNYSTLLVTNTNKLYYLSGRSSHWLHSKLHLLAFLSIGIEMR